MLKEEASNKGYAIRFDELIRFAVALLPSKEEIETGLRTKETSSGSVSRLIKEAVEMMLIKPLDPTTAPRYMKYIPYWA